MFNLGKISTNEFLTQIAAELDISDTDYLKAGDHYRAIGEWLGADDSQIAVFSPSIYPQGSFRLGTVVKPFGKDEFDLDLVCQLDRYPQNLTPPQLKKMVGDRLKQNATYLRMLEEKNRCWRLNYANEFHMDILPAVRDLTRNGGVILIPDKELAGWKSSNPEGYVAWFTQRMATDVRKFAEIHGVEIEQVPTFAVKSPLQRAIQLLKRHRDIRFNMGELADDKPISIIITTLAARIYRNEQDVYTAVINIVKALYAHAPLLAQGGQVEEAYRAAQVIKKGVEGRWYIPNPANSDENFADKWHENNNRRAKAFFQWVDWLRADLDKIVQRIAEDSDGKIFKSVFGGAVVGKAIASLGKLTASRQTASSPPHVKIESPGKPWSRHA